MNVRRGDVVMTRFPHAGGPRGKKRPVVVVQSRKKGTQLISEMSCVPFLTGTVPEWSIPEEQKAVLKRCCTSHGRQGDLRFRREDTASTRYFAHGAENIDVFQRKVLPARQDTMSNVRPVAQRARRFGRLGNRPHDFPARFHGAS